MIRYWQRLFGKEHISGFCALIIVLVLLALVIAVWRFPGLAGM